MVDSAGKTDSGAPPIDPEVARRRWLSNRLPGSGERRIMVLTGARQTGKTTLAKQVFGELRYLNLDDVELRASLREVRTSSWARTVGAAVLDEAQKEPSVFEKVKYAFDEGSLDFTVLLGSSRILLLDKVRESLAGRAFVYDLWPLMLGELAAETPADPAAFGTPLDPPLLERLLSGEPVADRLPVTDRLKQEPEVLFGDEEERRLRAFDHLARWGGMPGLLHLDDEDRRLWLRSYQQTYLERDLVDLVRLSDLAPFQKLQTLAMLRSGQILSYSELARDAQIGATTARRYLEYLDLTYQVVRLQPFLRNLTSSVIKSPKLYWTDLGLLRQGTGQWGPLDGALFETLVVAEVVKWLSSSASDVEPHFYRTRSGLEVDLLLRIGKKVLGLEIKNRETVVSKDARSLNRLAEALGEDWLGGLVVYRGRHLRPLETDESTWAMPVHRLFTP